MSEHETTAAEMHEPDIYELITQLENFTHLNVTSTDAETSQKWAHRRNKARAILFDRIASLTARAVRAEEAIASLREIRGKIAGAYGYPMADLLMAVDEVLATAATP